MPPHSISHSMGADKHLPDLLNGDTQFPKQLDPAQGLHLFFAILTVAVFGVALGAQQTLFFVEANILFGNSNQCFHFIYFHVSHRLFFT